jgi:hypothetical protein
LKEFEEKRGILDFKKKQMQFGDFFPENMSPKEWIYFSKDLEFNIQVDGLPFKAVLDTGSNRSFILKSFIPPSFLPILSDSFLGGQPWDSIQPKNQEIIFKPMVEPWLLFVMEFTGSPVDIIIGIDALKNKTFNLIEKKFLLVNSDIH